MQPGSPEPNSPIHKPSNDIHCRCTTPVPVKKPILHTVPDNDDSGGEFDLDTFAGGVNSLALVMVGVLIKQGLPHGASIMIVNEAVDILKRQMDDDAIGTIGDKEW